MGAPPDRGMTRSEIHEGIRLAADELIRLYDASEDASTGEERERADKELYNFMLGLLADVAGPAIGRGLNVRGIARYPANLTRRSRGRGMTKRASIERWRGSY